MQTDTKPCPRCGEPLASADDAEGCRDPLCPAPMIDYGDTERTVEDVVADLRQGCLDWDFEPMSDDERPMLSLTVKHVREAADLIKRQQARIEELETKISWFEEGRRQRADPYEIRSVSVKK